MQNVTRPLLSNKTGGGERGLHLGNEGMSHGLVPQGMWITVDCVIFFEIISSDTAILTGIVVEQPNGSSLSKG